MIWNLIRRVSSKPDGALFPAERSPAPRLPGAPSAPLPQPQAVPGSGRSSSRRGPQPAPFLPEASSLAGLPALFPRTCARRTHRFLRYPRASACGWGRRRWRAGAGILPALRSFRRTSPPGPHGPQVVQPGWGPVLSSSATKYFGHSLHMRERPWPTWEMTFLKLPASLSLSDPRVPSPPSLFSSEERAHSHYKTFHTDVLVGQCGPDAKILGFIPENCLVCSNQRSILLPTGSGVGG